MSRKGNYRDNAVAESFFARLRNEEATGVHDSKAAARLASPAASLAIRHACTPRPDACHLSPLS
jgi:transposase InsO family protein